MSYKPDTILALKEPRSTNDKPFPYDRVRVVGVSPMTHGVSAQEWGADGAGGIIIQPAGETFGPTIDEPFGKLRELYDVVSIPEAPTLSRNVEVDVYEPGPSPEQIFKQESEEAHAKKKPTKQGTEGAS